MQEQKSYSFFANQFSDTICQLTKNKLYSNIIFLCIGTDRVTGDSFGPLVGYKLKNVLSHIQKVDIIGDLDETVSNRNILDAIQYIQTNYKNPFIVSIDSALSIRRNVGDIIVSNQGIYLGTSIRDKKVYIGDMSIQGVVAKNTCVAQYNFKRLQNTNLGLIMKMADTVASGIISSIEFT